MTAFFAGIPAGAFLMGSDAGQDDERPVHRVP
jgi:formylglycine-generating enzyme required for sulfatase activity